MQEINLDWILTKVKNILRFVPDDGAVGQILRRTAHGAEWSDEQGGGGGAVSSVNGQTGAVVLTASDVGALPDTYAAPVDSVNGQTGTVVLDASDVGALPDTYAAPVDSVNGQTGVVVLDAGDVGALPDTYAAPVDSVNGHTGVVVLDAGDVGALPDTTVIPDSTSDLVNDSGFVDAAGAMAAALPSVIVDDTSTNVGTATFDKTYTVSGSGVIAVFASVLSDDSNDFGTWQARIYHNGNIIMGEGTRFTTAYAYAFGASTSAPIQVSNGDTIRIYLYNTKNGTKYGYRRFMCFGGCSVS